ncbi:MAG TPA: ABC transporter substrate-binding protein [Candidatus Wunengus sp. YC61]|uniref:ABC transporter substrate-binding protein n=1 Tax=Candidatus Wunengus sp. YC61 TaxID=3367698 RepID=UPI004026E04E
MKLIFYACMIEKYLHPRRIKIFTALWFILAILSQISFLSPQIFAKENTVVIIQSQQIAAYNEAIKGFEEGSKGKNISINSIYNLNGDADEGKRIIQNIKDNKHKPDLVLAVGILAATLVKEQFTDIPIIFCMVINHKRFNLEGNNITGISSEVSVEDQFTILKELLGARKNVGVIYDPAKTGNIVSEADRMIKKLEFNFIKKEVTSESEVIPALKNMIDKIDALWMIPDSTVITKTSLKAISKTLLEHHLPIFCTSDAIVKAGALVSVSPDYTYTGRQAAQMAQTLLNNPITTSLGIKQPDKLKLTLNTQTAEIIGINLTSFQSHPDVVLYP